MAIENSYIRTTEKLGKAFAGYWIGFLLTFGIYVEFYRLVSDIFLSGSGQAPPPPILGFVLAATATFVGKHTSVWFE